MFNRLAPNLLYLLPQPHRYYDTRNGAGGISGKVVSGAIYSLRVAGENIVPEQYAIPLGASAVLGNLAIIDPEGAGHVTIWPANNVQPVVSNLNFSYGQIIANSFVCLLNEAGRFNVSFAISSGGRAHFVVDVTGYYMSAGYAKLPGETELDIEY